MIDLIKRWLRAVTKAARFYDPIMEAYVEEVKL